MILPLPQLPRPIDDDVASIGDDGMGTAEDHRKWAEGCVAMAWAAEDHKDRALWLMLAQSWVRLAEDVALLTDPERDTEDMDDPVEMPASN
jgi:hypothetical protein